MSGLHILIVDDEPLARERIRRLLELEPDIERVEQCGNGFDAIEALTMRRPDIMFLDIQMPQVDGFEVINAVDPDTLPVIIFVTAHDRFALKAFDVHALDYLLKPFDDERFRTALRRARRQLQAGPGDRNPEAEALLEHVRNSAWRPGRLMIRSSGRIYFLQQEEVDWIESAGNYVCLHVGARSHLMRETMQRLEARLDPQRFTRIHRTRIVNVDRIEALRPIEHGDCEVSLHNGTMLSATRNHRERLVELLRRRTGDRVKELPPAPPGDQRGDTSSRKQGHGGVG